MANEQAREQLKTLSQLLTAIHKDLMDFQMAEYSASHGPPQSAGQKLNLLLSDPQFQWLRVLSQMISDIDGVVFSRDPVEAAAIHTAVTGARRLFFANEVRDFADKYQLILEAQPDLLFLHHQLKGLVEKN
jgi:hypothetical protein